MTATMNIYTIPPGEPFVDTLAAGLVKQAEGHNEDLAAMRVLLPTRRACRALREAFLRRSGGKPLLLPRMQPIGDADEDELQITAQARDIAALPREITPMERRALLAELIRARGDWTGTTAQSFKLVESLGHLLDQIIIEGLSFDALEKLVPEKFSEHWQITTQFLKIIGENWTGILKERGAIDQADRRNRLIRLQAQEWRNHPPRQKIIAAGSTGSFPAVRELLHVIASMPQGCVVLPGLDRDMDAESWQKLDETHPQYMLRQLLTHCGADRREVAIWPETAHASAREALAREIMRPAQTTQSWQNLKIPEEPLQNLRRYDCKNPHEEALVIACALRETLEKDEHATAALITPDRQLARRVAGLCRRWNIALDDSGGQALDETEKGTFLRLALNAVLSDFAPVPLLSALKHGCASRAGHGALPQELDACLRGLKPVRGFQGLHHKLLKEKERNKETDHLSAFLTRLEAAFEPLATLAKNGPQPLSKWLDAHIKTAESLAAGDNEKAAARLWTGDDGEQAALFLSELRGEARHFPDMNAEEYAEILEQLMRDKTVRPSYGTHPRLHILGALEARLVQADRVILGGLNEKSWPPDTGNDPWMSRPMRKDFGLGALERRTGQSAHDFVQAFCAQDVILTRSEQVDGAPSVPSRWLQRLDTVLKAAGIDENAYRAGPHLRWARALDKEDDYSPVKRPAPKPPPEARPRALSVTAIEEWMKDPYGVYAKHILRLRKMDDLEKEIDAAERGTIIHAIMERFSKAFDPVMPDSAASDLFLSIAAQTLEETQIDEGTTRLWQPRLRNLAVWSVSYEKSWREKTRLLQCEAEGAITIRTSGNDFTLKARADRIDLYHAGGAAITDFKSGGSYPISKLKSAALPQLPLEGLILRNGGFENLPAHEVKGLSYCVLTGGKTPGNVTLLENDDLTGAIETASDGLKTLIETFDLPETPYLSAPDPKNAPRFSDYTHLARVKEWSVMGDQEEAA